MDNEKIITELYDYYQKILLPYQGKKLKGYTFEICDRSAVCIFINDSDDRLQLYATPFYECLYDGLCISQIDDRFEYTNETMLIIPIEITGNEEKDVEAYFKLCEKYL